jgi:hypothetical protein
VREPETIDSELRFVEQVGPELDGNRVPVYWFVVLRRTAPVTSMNGSTSA